MAPLNPKLAIPVDTLYKVLSEEFEKHEADLSANDRFPWYQDVLNFDFEHARKHTSSEGVTIWTNFFVKVNEHFRPLVVLVNNEVVTGTIMPNSQEEVDRINAEAAES